MKKSLIILIVFIIVSAALIVFFDRRESKEKIKINSNMAVFVSDTLNISFTYPKELSFFEVTGKDEKFPVKVSEVGNKLVVDAGNIGSSYAFIFHKSSNETFEQAILREFVKTEYYNNPCFVKKIAENMYILTFPGDMGDAGGWEKEGSDNKKKCLTYPEFPMGGYFISDPETGGFYIAFNGGQTPVFGIDTSAWWPKGIKFIK